MSPTSLLVPAAQVIVPLAQAGGAVGGDAGSPNQDATGFLEILLSGGMVGMMILMVLFALSVAAAYLVFDQVMTLRRSEILPDGVCDVVRQALLTGSVFG